MEPLAPISFSQVLILMAIFLAAMVVMFIVLVLVLRRRQSKAVKFEAIHINDLIKLILSMGSFVMVLITLVFLVFQNRIIVTQTRYAAQSVESNVYSTVTSQNLGTDELFLKYPELRPYFYGGKQLNEDDPHFAMALAAAEYLLDNYDAQMMQLKKYPGLWRSEKGSWEANISDMFAWSPLLCRFLEAHAAWYGDDLIALKTAGEKKRDNGGRQQILPRQQPQTP
ncbi:MAG: hypothetical protein NTY36_15950 [Deltaproteobacteria bacterium]|nr:hypothetical protein [Deltaproteobacteria bacterium]